VVGAVRELAFFTGEVKRLNNSFSIFNFFFNLSLGGRGVGDSMILAASAA
jgi:hypothetical protein